MNLEKSFHVLSHIIKVILIIAIIFDILNGKFSQLFITLLTLIFLSLPNLYEKKYNVNIPLEIEVLISIFILGTLFLGENLDYYEKYVYWDVYLHTLSGFLLGLLGFVIVYSIIDSKSKNSLTPFFVSVFTFSFAVTIGALWEIFEFGMDNFFGLNMQKSGLVDTMWDLIVDSIGAGIVAISSYFYMKKVKHFGIIYPIIHKIAINKKEKKKKINKK